MKKQEWMKISGARVHNLKNVSVKIPLNKLTCFYGPSGSGKTSLAFHTILAESKRRFINSFPNSLKFFSERPSPVDVDEIMPVLPVFGLPQINPIMGSRSMVTDIIRLTDLWQQYFTQFSKPYCPKHHERLILPSIEKHQKTIESFIKSKVIHLFVHKKDRGENFVAPPRSWNDQGVRDFNESDDFWEIFRFKREKQDALETYIKEIYPLYSSVDIWAWGEGEKKLIKFSLSQDKQCPLCSFESKTQFGSYLFTPYSALGACPDCNGYGAKLVFDEDKLYRKDLSVEDGGLYLLNYSPFNHEKMTFIKIMKKNNWSLQKPIKEMPGLFWKILKEGAGNFCGEKELINYLESKRYKPSVRIYIRNLQKEIPCVSCQTSRLNPISEIFKINVINDHYSLVDLTIKSIQEIQEILNQAEIKNIFLKKIKNIIDIACGMGLGHLRLNRKSKTLSVGEYQRLLLLKYLSFEGTNSIFVLDEPSLGLSQKELMVFRGGLQNIINQGNTIIIIDHSKFLKGQSDYLIEMGPGSGEKGGSVLSQKWNLKNDLNLKTVKKINKNVDVSYKNLEVIKPSIFNINFPNFKFPLEKLIWVHGASGTGKSSCLIKVLANAIEREVNKDTITDDVGIFGQIKGKHTFEDVIVIDSELNRFTSRSSVGTLTELSSVIRKYYLKTTQAKFLNLQEGHLSPYSELGMCLGCEGKGKRIIEMQYLEDIVLECEDCKGKKLKPLYSQISDGKMTISEAMSAPLHQVLERIDLTPKFRRVFEYIKLLHLDYLSLERPINSLSGGEKQRIYLLSKLLKSPQNTLIIMENPSFGLSTLELNSLAEFLLKIRKMGNTVVIIDASEEFQEVAEAEMVFEKDKIITQVFT